MKGKMMHGVYNCSGPNGFWEHGHPPCEECLKYHEHIKAIIAERDEAKADNERLAEENDQLRWPGGVG